MRRECVVSVAPLVRSIRRKDVGLGSNPPFFGRIMLPNMCGACIKARGYLERPARLLTALIVWTAVSQVCDESLDSTRTVQLWC